MTHNCNIVLLFWLQCVACLIGWAGTSGGTCFISASGDCYTAPLSNHTPSATCDRCTLCCAGVQCQVTTSSPGQLPVVRPQHTTTRDGQIIGEAASSCHKSPALDRAEAAAKLASWMSQLQQGYQTGYVCCVCLAAAVAGVPTTHFSCAGLQVWMEFPLT